MSKQSLRPRFKLQTVLVVLLLVMLLFAVLPWSGRFGPQMTIRQLGSISYGDKAGVPFATSQLGSDDLLVRAAAAKALGTIGPSAESAVPDLINALKITRRL